MSGRRLWIGMAAVAFGLVMVQPPAPAQMVRYDGHRVVRADVATPEQLDLLLGLTDDVWSEAVGLGQIDVRVSPEQFAELLLSGLPFEVLIEDLQPLIDAQFASAGTDDPFDHYMNLAEMLAYLDTLVALRPDLAQTFDMGDTIEGRDIIGIRITGPGSGPKPGVLYHGAIHAREWITPPAAIYIADQLIRKYDTDPYLRDLVDRLEWFIVPVLNVDGYVYTWTTERMWRKNRRPPPAGSTCYGVDNNRNFGVGWGGQGSSGDPCSETYRGTAAFSEPETQAVRDWILGHTNILAYCDLHSYAQLIMHPYGYTSNLPPEPDRTYYAYLAQTQHDLVQSVHGLSYGFGPIYSTIYPVGGGSIDWVYEVGHHVHQTFGFTYELRDTGQYGFVLPASQILPNAEEVFPALLFFADYMGTPQQLIDPNGGQIWSVGGPRDIIWRAQGGTITGVDLYYSTDGGNTFPHVIAAGEPNDGRYTWTIPNTPSLYCRVKIVVHRTGSPDGEDVSDANFRITAVTPQLLYDFPLDTNPGWTTQAQWAFGVPAGLGGAHGFPDPTGGHTGTNVYGYNLSGDYSNNMPEYHLTTAPLNCSGAPMVTLKFWRWLGVEAPDSDHAYVRVSRDGTNWTNVWQNTTEIADNSWVYQEFDISAVAGGQSAVSLRWTMGTTDAFWRYCGWNIDDIQVWGMQLPQFGRADLNCDGGINAFDIDPFVLAMTNPAAYYAGYPECDIRQADINQDGQINAFDIDPFVICLTLGACP